MTGRSTTERILDAYLAPEADRLPDRVIDAALADIAKTPQQRTPRVPWRFPKMPNMTSTARTVLVGAVLLLAVGGATIFIASNQPDLPAVSPSAAQSPSAAPSPSSAPSPSAAPSPSQIPTASAEVAMGWPTPSENGPGLDSWDGQRCAGTFCSHGVMHNGYGAGNVVITIQELPEEPAAAGATAVTIAGHSGLYRRVVEPEPSIITLEMPGLEEWVVDIEGVWVTIRLYAEPGASEANLADAHAIIDSLRYEPTTGARGFRLTFRLTNSEWDSG